jgi:hypothetical protein
MTVESVKNAIVSRVVRSLRAGWTPSYIAVAWGTVSEQRTSFQVRKVM